MNFVQLSQLSVDNSASTQSITLINDSDVANEIPQVNNSQDSNIENIIPVNSTSQNLYLKCMPIIDIPTCDDVWNAYVTNINSLKCFYVQNTNNLKYIGEIYKALELDKNDLIPSNKLPSIGTLVAARNENGLWCRAKIIKKDKLGLSVSFIDFGNNEVIVKDLKNLPTELTNIKPMVYQCFSNNVQTETDKMLFNTDLKDAVTKFFDTNEITVTFMNNTEPYSVKLLYNGRDILDSLPKLAWEGIIPGLINDSIDQAKYEMMSKMSGCNQFVTCIEPITSIDHFYIETEQSNTNGKTIETKIRSLNYYNDMDDLKEGDLVIAINEENFGRARIVMNYDKYFKCFLIDYAKFIYCSEVYKLNENYLLTTPPVKIYCALHMPRKIDRNVMESVSMSFINEISRHKCYKVSKLMNVVKVGSPCMINLEIQGLKMHSVIAPCQVNVIYIENMNSFKVRVDSKDSRKINDVLKCKEKFVPISCPEKSKIYVTNYNGQNVRVKYIGPSASEFNVSLVDDSRKHFITNTLYQLPEALKNIKVMDILCSLELSCQIYSTNKFIEICNEGKTKFTMVTMKSGQTNGQHVKLFLNYTDIKTMIIRELIFV